MAIYNDDVLFVDGATDDIMRGEYRTKFILRLAPYLCLAVMRYAASKVSHARDGGCRHACLCACSCFLCFPAI